MFKTKKTVKINFVNLIYFLIFSICVFLCALVGGKRYRSTTLYALAIGGVVNANFFHAGNYPINCFGLPFSIDSVIYTLFIFCIVVMFIKEGKCQAYLLAISSIVAIMFSAVMQLVSDVLSKGSSIEVWLTFLTFTISALASIVAIIAMLELLEKLKTKINQYGLLVIGILVATIIDTLIYFPASLLFNGMPTNIGLMLLTSFIGKILAILCSILTLKLINKYDKQISK